jgi:hypothetical protein
MNKEPAECILVIGEGVIWIDPTGLSLEDLKKLNKQLKESLKSLEKENE